MLFLLIWLLAWEALLSTSYGLLQQIRTNQGMEPPGNNLPLRPGNAVFQRDAGAYAVKLIPVDKPGVWKIPIGEMPTTLTPESQLKRAATHYDQFGNLDSTYGGTNLNTPYATSIDGYNYLRAAPPALPPPPSNEGLPIGGGTKVSVAFPGVPSLTPFKVKDIFPTMVPLNLPPMPNLQLGPLNLNVPSPNLPEMPQLNIPQLKAPRMPSLAVPSFSVPVWKGFNIPSFNMGDFAFGLPSLGSLPNFKLPIWSPKFPAFNLNVQLPKLDLGLKFPKFEGPLFDVDLSGKKPLLDIVCIRDFSAKCPSGWLLENKLCVSPRSYEGACPRLMDFSGYTSKDLSKWSLDCGVKWPCLNDRCEPKGGRDYSTPCPEKWVLADGVCLPNKEYAGSCRDASYNLKSYSTDQKESFASTCQVFWPCKIQDCEQDYSNPCPQFFKLDGARDLCIKLPSATWTPCAETPIGVTTWTVEEKQEWSARCSAPWPCVTTNRSPCSKNYDQPCPIEFVELEKSEGLCEILDDFLIPTTCTTIVDFRIAFGGWSVKQKKDFEDSCHVHWPCVGETPPNHACPIGFHLSIHQNSVDAECESDHPIPSNPCTETRNFNHMSPHEISTLARVCGFVWESLQALPSSPLLHLGADLGGSRGIYVE